MTFVFRPTSPTSEECCCERPDGVGKALLLDAAKQNGVDVNSSEPVGCGRAGPEKESNA